MFNVQWKIVIKEIYGVTLQMAKTREGEKSLTPTAFCRSIFRPLPLCMTLFILLMGLTFMFVLVPVVFVSRLLLLLFMWFEIVQIFSFGLSLPTDTGRGLSEHGDASRDTDSESSSLNGFPVIGSLDQRVRLMRLA